MSLFHLDLHFGIGTIAAIWLRLAVKESQPIGAMLFALLFWPFLLLGVTCAFLVHLLSFEI